jgi:hypothetical protein
MIGEPTEFPRGQQKLDEFLNNLDEHLDFGPILVEVRNKYISSRFYLCRTKADFEHAMQGIGKLDEIWVSECSEIEPQCKLLKE